MIWGESARGRYFGRSFLLKDGTLVLPCEFCGSPVWPELVDTHLCQPMLVALLEEMDQLDRDAWRDL